MIEQYTIELEVSYHGDASPKFFRLRIEEVDEDNAYATIMGNLEKYGIPLFDEDKEPIHGVTVAYAAKSSYDAEFLPKYGRGQEA